MDQVDVSEEAVKAASLKLDPMHRAQDEGLPKRSVMATVARNSAFVLGVQVVLKVLAFLFNVYVVRQLGF